MQTTKLVLISVTQDHINNGQRKNGWACPIALAINDAGIFEEAKGHLAPTQKEPSSVFVQNRRVWKDKSCEGYKLPLFARAFVQQFDAGRKVEPFEFEIDLLKVKYK